MKFNKWTLGLAAVGAVSLTSVAQAEEKMMLASQANLTATTISGYVDVSAQWNLGNTTGAGGVGVLPPYSFGGTSKADGFNLNVIQLTVAKALDESEWAAGYRADLWFGPDAGGLGSQSSRIGAAGAGDVAIRQAYVALRTPIGNGIDWKVGVFDTIIGYETIESGNNPNYTRSYGFSIEPTTHTGVLGTYHINDSISVAAGVANTFGPVINQRANLGGNTKSEDNKTYMASVALTAPSDWGWVAGSSLYFGVVSGFNSAIVGGQLGASGPGVAGGNETHYYAGLTLATPVAGLKFGAAFDYLNSEDRAGAFGDEATVFGLYASYQATEKLSLHARGEYALLEGNRGSGPGGVGGATVGIDDLSGTELTFTAQYDLWKNVISRAEIRWDHSENQTFAGPNTTGFGRLGNQQDTFLVAANFIYKF